MLDQKAIRVELLQKLKEMRQRTERIEEHQQEMGREVPKDWEDLAQYRENDEVVAQLDDLTRDEALRIQATLRRMDDGTWGTCAACGKAIEPMRLTALPTSPTCVACAHQAEPR